MFAERSIKLFSTDCQLSREGRCIEPFTFGPASRVCVVWVIDDQAITQAEAVKVMKKKEEASNE